jgi:hypothetical protein
MESHMTAESSEDGENVRKRSGVEDILVARGDPGIQTGCQLLFIAPDSVHEAFRNKPFSEALSRAIPGEMIAINVKMVEGTDRMSSVFLQMLDAIRVDRTEGYVRAESAYDRLHGWDTTRRRFASPYSLDYQAVRKPEAIARTLEIDRDFPQSAQTSNKLHQFVVTSLENPDRTELYCLALATGLIREDSSGRIFLFNEESGERLVLLNSPRPQIDRYVDGLVHWSLGIDKQEWKAWEDYLRSRFDNFSDIDRARMETWLDSQPPPLDQGSIDRISLGMLVTTLVRNYFRNRKRRWIDD